ncbi:MAG: winged helix-turn-helix domain-containing protein [Alphaproteobacteria bacterium]|nr:winged helix-turn-helix domain-containing protein [Alphaproteobacteria bacterium]
MGNDTGASPRLSNRAARRLFLDRHGLCRPPPGEDLAGLIERLGFVQVDSIATVERAHHMILASRRRSYRPRQLDHLLERRRALFEHWTHDASVIPMAFYPHWRLRFRRDADMLRARWRKWRRAGFEARFEDVLERIREGGPVMAREFGGDRRRTEAGWWDWHPSKTALEYLWRTGALAIARREGFQKVFDLAERVVPAPVLASLPTEEETLDWACAGALDRLGFATPREIASFWDTASLAEARAWCAAQGADALVEVEVEGAEPGRARRLFARPDICEQAERACAPPGGVRVLSPFDPLLRDRRRAEWLFGFRFRIEIFVPEEKREYGYYVFPLLEGDRPVGRIDMRRREGRLCVRALWPERGVRLGKGRLERIGRELDRIARFAGCEGAAFENGWIREARM